MTKSEGMRKSATAQLRVFRHSGFGFHSSFVIQRLVQVRFMVPMHGIQVVKALHEPTVRSPGFSRSGPPEGGTPNKQVASPRTGSSSQCMRKNERGLSMNR